MDIHGWVLFGDPARAKEAKRALEAEGYRAELQPQQHGAVVILAIPPDPSLTPAALSTRLQPLASNFEGEFTGYGGGHQTVL